MFPKIFENKNEKNNLELFKKDEEIIDLEEDDDEDEELTSSSEGLPLCAKVGLGLLGLAIVGYGVCKFTESKSSDSLTLEDGDFQS